MKLVSWGGLTALSSEAWEPRHRNDLTHPCYMTMLNSEGAVVYGGGRSYSDVALPASGSFPILTSAMSHIVSFDRVSGVIEVEAGATLASIQEVALGAGWGLSILPGTAWATAGGALANDVHGKNHAVAGSFSRCVVAVRLFRADQGLIEVSRLKAALWAATVGGLGATGLIVTLRIQLVRWPSVWIAVEQHRFTGVGEFLELSNSDAEYIVGWVDTFASPVRGVLFLGRHSDRDLPCQNQFKKVTLPLPRAKLINGVVSKVFNAAYWASHPDGDKKLVNWRDFFCPLDKIDSWNRLYGSRGFSQFQCVVPSKVAKGVYGEVFTACRKANQGSFLSVIKKFGDIESEGVLSFARSGVTFAMDFPNQMGTKELLTKLTQIVVEAGGALYPAKMNIDVFSDFEKSFPCWRLWRSEWDSSGALSGSVWVKRLGLGDRE